MLIAAVLLWLFILLRVLGPTARVSVPLCAILLVPADNIVQLSGPAKGLFPLAVAFVLTVAVVLGGNFRLFSWADWDVHLVCIVSLAAVALHAESGSLRVGLYWAVAVLLFAWLHAESAADAMVPTHVLRALVLTGVITSGVAILEQLGRLDFAGVLPFYEPDRSQFAAWLGLRAVGFAGHPLRLGTTAMLALIASMAVLIDTNRPTQARLLHLTAVLICGAALILSGARGAWLGAAVGCAAVIAHRFRQRLSRTVAQLIATAALGAGFLWVSGLGELVYERLAGGAVSPHSLQQRLDALRTVVDIGSSIPALGTGYGGVEDILYRGGLVVPNIENEYLLSLVAQGPIGPLLLILVGYRRGLLSWSGKDTLVSGTAFGCVLALWLNIATYNLFSSSIGAGLLCVIAFTARPRQPPAGQISVRSD